MGRGEREDGNERWRQTTLHSFRRFVRTTISDLGYADYSEYFIGHSGSSYWRKKDSEKAEIFLKIEPYLTFLNVHELERQGADIQSKVEQLEQPNHSMRDRDKMKDYAIAHLSDQLIALTSRFGFDRNTTAIEGTAFYENSQTEVSKEAHQRNQTVFNRLVTIAIL